MADWQAGPGRISLPIKATLFASQIEAIKPDNRLTTEGEGNAGGGGGVSFDTGTFSKASLSRYVLHSPYDLFGPIMQLPLASVIQQAPYKAGQLGKAIYLGVSTLPGVRSEL